MPGPGKRTLTLQEDPTGNRFGMKQLRLNAVPEKRGEFHGLQNNRPF